MVSLRYLFRRSDDDSAFERLPTTITPAGVEDVDDALRAVGGPPSVYYLHDPWCPLSRRALREVERAGGTVGLVDVTGPREVGTTIEHLTGVRHESPQVLVIRDGQVRWHTSHLSITAEAIRRARESAE